MQTLFYAIIQTWPREWQLQPFIYCGDSGFQSFLQIFNYKVGPVLFGTRKLAEEYAKGLVPDSNNGTIKIAEVMINLEP